MATVQSVVNALLASNAHKATKYLGDKTVVRATRRLLRGKIANRRNSTIDIVLTIGRPNYLERKFLAQCRKAGEPIPVKKIQLKFPPKRRAA